MKICQANNNDIRACLGVLQIIKLDPRYAENQT